MISFLKQKKLEVSKHKNIGTPECRKPNSNNSSCRNPLHTKNKVFQHLGAKSNLHI